MKTIAFVALLALSIALPGGALALAARQETPKIPAGSTVAYISAQRIMTETVEGKAQLTKLQTTQQQKMNELRARQQTLETMRQQLAVTTDAAKRTSLQQQEQVQRGDLERATAQAQADLQLLQRQVNADLQIKVKPILDELLKGTDVRLVLSADTAVLWGAPGLDLTTAVIERMNAKSAESKP